MDGGIGDDRGQDLVGEAGNGSAVVDQLREHMDEGGGLCQEGVNLRSGMFSGVVDRRWKIHGHHEYCDRF